MLVVVVCTGNVARSPALAQIMAWRKPDIEFWSAAVGKNAKPGLKMRKPMREMMKKAGFGDYAELHESRLLMDLTTKPDLLVGVAPVHMKYLAEIAPDIPRVLTQPAIIDPVWGGPQGYEVAWKQILEAAAWLDEWLERE